MKKIILTVLAVLLMASNLYAADGSCTQTAASYPGGFYVVTFACTGDSATGAIPNQTVSTGAMSILKGYYYLYQVVAYPTPGGTAPDAADVTVSMDNQDLLGTKGVNLIHATATYDTHPYSAFMTAYRYPAITSNVSMAVANQATASANYTVKLIFVK
jgi:hypothetical protein